MKRSHDFTKILNNDGEPMVKVALVERNSQPGGLELESSCARTSIFYKDKLALSEGVSNVNAAVQSNARNKLEIIGRQMKHLQGLMTDVFNEANLNIDLHSVACNFVKKPGKVYHLYENLSGQKYFGMLSPEEWQNPPHRYLGSYMLEADSSWTPARLQHSRNEGIDYLQNMFIRSSQVQVENKV